MSRALRVALCAGLLVGWLSACGGGGDGPTGPATVASLTLTASAPTLGALGETATLTAVAKSAKGAVISAPTLTWSSSDANVASVSGGIVTAVGNGTATISASAGSVTGSASITVQQSVASVSVSFASDTLRALGDTVRATASARDARNNAVNGKTATWSSLTPAVATVDPNGVITAVSEGDAIVSATVDARSAQRTIAVRQRASRLVITQQPAGARAGIALTTQPIAELQDARGNRVSTDNTTVVTASVVSGGSVTAGATATASSGVVTFTALAIGGAVGSKVIQLGGPAVGSVNATAVALAAGNPSTMVVVSGGGQTGLANTALAQPLSAAVRDAFGNAVAAVPVSFAVTQGGGSVSPAQANTDANGSASTTYTLGKNAGSASVRATSSAVASAQADFAVTVTPNGIISGSITVQRFNIAIDNGVAGAAKQAASVSSARAVRQAAHRRLLNAPAFTATPSFAIKPAPVASSVSRAVETSAPAATDEYVPGELLVTYYPVAIGAPAMGSRAYAQRSVAAEVVADVREALAAPEAEGVVHVAGVSPAMLTARVTLAPGVTEQTAMARLRRDPRVRAVERNGVMRVQRVMPTQMDRYLERVTAEPTVSLAGVMAGDVRAAAFPVSGNYPDNPLFVNQSWHYNMMDLPQAWQQTQGSTSVLVAVVDDGIRFDHPAMAGVLTSDGYDFVPVGTVAACAGGTVSTNGDGDGPDPDPTQPSDVSFNNAQTCVFSPEASGNHGLHVSGTIGATRTNSTGIVGVNWSVKIRPVRVLGVHGSGSNFTVAQGILYAAGLPADNGAGGTVTTAGPPARVINLSLGSSSNNVAVQTAIAQAQAAGVLIVAAAGNNNNSTAFYPASYPDVVSVSALGPTLLKATYSNYGPTVTVSAPGGNTSGGPSHGITSSTWNYQTNAPRTDSWQGTSMATPHVTGLAALILAKEPSLTAAQLRARIVNFSYDLGPEGRDNIYGAGLVNARNSLTASLAPAKTITVRLVNATTGAVVRTVQAVNGAYQIGGLADGSYWVFAGEDVDGDGLTGLPSRAWGAFGDASAPTPIVISGAAVYPASFEIFRGFEFEPNGTADVADELLVDGILNGDLTTLGDVDFFRVRVAQAGTYTIQVTGQSGACRYALEADPTLALLSSAGSTLASNDDIDVAKNDYCSRITTALTPGDYYVRVGAALIGRYVVGIRKQ